MKSPEAISIGWFLFCFREGLVLPQESEDRVRLLKEDPELYVRTLTHDELVRVVDGVARSGPLSEEGVAELLDERYPVVRPEWIPEELW